MKLHTKSDYQEMLLNLLKPLENKFSDGCARIRLSGAGACYSQDAIDMEAFARPLWGLVPYWAGGGKGDNFQAKYQKGIVNGTNPNHPEYWGECKDTDQKFVEMTPIALGILMTPSILWDPLSDVEKDNLANWLNKINNYSLPKCNWYFFRILVNLALREVHHPYSDELLKSDMAYMESCYLGDGWFVDGESCQKDYYSAFAMQFYGIIYACFAKDDPKRSIRFKQYAENFSQDFIYWFDKNGAALPFGRSLTYRFAQVAFWSATVFSDISPDNLGVTKGIINRNFEYWLSKDIFKGDDTLSIGYGYANLSMAEHYNAPGSPYWCCKAFLLLALPDDHLFWQTAEQPLPKLDKVKCLKKADMLVQHNGNNVSAYVPAVYSKNVLGHFTEKYAKFAYSTNFAFSVAHSQDLISENAPDSMLAFVPVNDTRVYVRRRSISYEVLSNSIMSVWSPLDGIVVETTITLCEDGHIRCHKITSDKECNVYDCGFSVAVLEKDNIVETGESFIKIGNQQHGCKIETLLNNMTPHLINASPNTNLLYKNTQIPSMLCKIGVETVIIENKITTYVNDFSEDMV